MSNVVRRTHACGVTQQSRMHSDGCQQDYSCCAAVSASNVAAFAASDACAAHTPCHTPPGVQLRKAAARSACTLLHGCMFRLRQTSRS